MVNYLNSCFSIVLCIAFLNPCIFQVPFWTSTETYLRSNTSGESSIQQASDNCSKTSSVRNTVFQGQYFKICLQWLSNFRARKEHLWSIEQKNIKSCTLFTGEGRKLLVNISWSLITIMTCWGAFQNNWYQYCSIVSMAVDYYWLSSEVWITSGCQQAWTP